MNGYSCHVDHLQIFLTQSPTVFDVVFISETSLNNDDIIPDSALLLNYKYPFTTNTLSSKGGVAIFVNSNLDVFEREDLKFCHKEFETVWVEIKNKCSKNTVIGCTYRLPHQKKLTTIVNI